MLNRKFARLSSNDMVKARQVEEQRKRDEKSAARKAENVERRAAQSAAVAREQKALDHKNEHPPRGVKGALGVSTFVKCRVLEVNR